MRGVRETRCQLFVRQLRLPASCQPARQSRAGSMTQELRAQVTNLLGQRMRWEEERWGVNICLLSGPPTSDRFKVSSLTFSWLLEQNNNVDTFLSLSQPHLISDLLNISLTPQVSLARPILISWSWSWASCLLARPDRGGQQGPPWTMSWAGQPSLSNSDLPNICQE